MSIYNEIGLKIVYLRKKKGLTQEKLAYDCGASPSYLGDIERGNANPSINELIKIAGGLGVDVKYLLY